MVGFHRRHWAFLPLVGAVLSLSSASLMAQAPASGVFDLPAVDWTGADIRDGDLIIINPADNKEMMLYGLSVPGTPVLNTMLSSWAKVGTVFEIEGRTADPYARIKTREPVHLKVHGTTQYLGRSGASFVLMDRHPVHTAWSFLVLRSNASSLRDHDKIYLAGYIDIDAFVAECHPGPKGGGGVCLHTLSESAERRSTWMVRSYRPRPPLPPTRTFVAPPSPPPVAPGAQGGPYICTGSRELNFAGCKGHYVYLCNSGDRNRQVTVSYNIADGSHVRSIDLTVSVPAQAAIGSGAVELPGGTQFGPDSFGPGACRPRGHAIKAVH